MATKPSPKRTRSMPVKESQMMHEALIFYFESGNDRTLQMVADQFDRSLNTVKRWSSIFNWGLRLIEFERTVSARLETKSLDRVTQARDTSLNLLSSMKGRFTKELLDDDKKHLIANMGDLDKVIRAEQLLLDKPDSRVAAEGITFISSVPSPDDNAD